MQTRKLLFIIYNNDTRHIIVNFIDENLTDNSFILVLEVLDIFWSKLLWYLTFINYKNTRYLTNKQITNNLITKKK